MSTDIVSSNKYTTGKISIGGSVNGTIDYAGDQDWYAINLVAGQTYVINLEGSVTGGGTLSDTYLRGIYNANGTLISGTTNDDGGFGTNSKVTFTALSTGVYYISAGAYSTRTGTYRLSVALTDDYSNSILTAGKVEVGSSITGKIETSGDKDMFGVNLTAGQKYTIKIKGAASGGGTCTDTYLNGIYNANGTLISGTVNDNGSSNGRDAELVFTANATGMFYISAGAAGINTGTYTLTVDPFVEQPVVIAPTTTNTTTESTTTSTTTTTTTPAVTATVTDTPSVINTISTTDRIGASVATAGRIDVNGSVLSRINSTSDVDLFKVYLTAGEQYTITMNKYGSTGGLSNALIKGIYNSTGTAMMSRTTDYNSGGNLNALITFTPTNSGYYYIAADGYGTSIGNYELSIKESAGNSVDWSVMEYMSADNNLEIAALYDVNEMEAACIASNITVTCELDRSASYTTVDGNWSNTRRGVIVHDGLSSRISSLATNMSEQNMGSVSTLTDFINYSQGVSTADNDALILWNHGGGVSGCCVDYGNGFSRLSNQDIATAITNSDAGHLDVVAFDACLMGVLDQSFALRDVTDFVVASEDLVPGTGFDYDAFYNQFSASTDQSAEHFSELLVQTYDAANTSAVTLAALDMSEMNDLIDAMANFSLVWDNSNQNNSLLKTAVDETLRFDSNIDLGDFMQNVADLSDSTAVDTAANQVISAVDNVVMTSCGPNDASGISVYMPTYEDSAYYTGNGASLLAATGWNTVYAGVYNNMNIAA